MATLIAALVIGLLGALSGLQGDGELTSFGNLYAGRLWVTPIPGMRDVADVSPTAVLLVASLLTGGVAASLLKL